MLLFMKTSFTSSVLYHAYKKRRKGFGAFKCSEHYSRKRMISFAAFQHTREFIMRPHSLCRWQSINMHTFIGRAEARQYFRLYAAAFKCFEFNHQPDLLWRRKMQKDAAIKAKAQECSFRALDTASLSMASFSHLIRAYRYCILMSIGFI